MLDGRLSLGLVPHVQSGISAQTEVFQSIIIIISIIVSNVIRGPPPLHQACMLYVCIPTCMYTRVSFWAASTASASLRGFLTHPLVGQSYAFTCIIKYNTAVPYYI